MSEEPRIETLDWIAAALHAGQLDQRQVPYIRHLRTVTAGVSDAAKPVALFHDALEDGVVSTEVLASILTPTELAAVKLLTRSDPEPYDVYIERLATADGDAGAIAREVKIADLQHNLGRLTPELKRLRPRYQRALATLT